MARSRSKKKKKSSGPFVSAQRKKELLGLILMVIAALLALALFTFSPGDRPIAQSLSWASIQPGAEPAQNALGIVGATVAYFLIPHFLGYTSLLFTFLLFAWGYTAFRNRSDTLLPFFSICTIAGAFVLAGFFGWFGLMLEADLQYWSGAVGQGLAAWLQFVFGAAGAFLLLMLAAAVLVLLVVDHDLQRTIDRLEEAGRGVREGVGAWLGRQREARAKRRERSQREREAVTEEAGNGNVGTEKAYPKRPGSNGETPAAKPRRKPGIQTVNDQFRNTPAPFSPPPQEGKPQPSPATPQTMDPQPPPTPPRKPAEPRHAEVTMRVQAQIEEEKTDEVEHDLNDVPRERKRYKFPTIELLDEAKQGERDIDYAELEMNKEILLDKLETYNIEITNIDAVVGPTVTRYELTPAPGVKISKITAREDDLAMAMAARGIRMIAPIPGKSAVGVEIPNRTRELVRVRDILGTAKFSETNLDLPLPLGKTIEGEVYLRDLTKMPHLLIAGATGSGKSVAINALIVSLLYACHPSNLKFVIIDPKKIELQQYEQLENHYLATFPGTDDAIITDFEEALGVLKSCEKEMERRYDLLSKASVRGIKEYNRKLKEGKMPANDDHQHLPYLVVVVDELADLMMTAGKDIEAPIARLAQMARAVGIHLVLATQRPSVDVITGLIKANFPARIAFQVASRVDSRTILDQSGAHRLVGNGDMLYVLGSEIMRLQAPFVSIDEVERIVEHISRQADGASYLLPRLDDPSDLDLDDVLAVTDRDDLFEQAAQLIVHAQQGSVSLLQRKLSVGYTRAARIVDQLEDAGIVGSFEGSKARDVLVQDLDELERMLEEDRES